MPEEKSPKIIGGLKLEPLKGKFFDIAPAPSGRKAQAFTAKADYFRFALTAFTAFMILSLGNAYMRGKELVDVGQESAYAGYESLKMGMDALVSQDTKAASEFFATAQNSFAQLSENTRHLTVQANQLSSQNLYVDTAGALVGAAMQVAEIGQALARIVQELGQLPGIILSADQQTDVMALVQKKHGDVKDLLAKAASLQRDLTSMNLGILPQSLQARLTQAQVQVGDFIAALLEVDRNFVVFQTMLGDDVPHRYLILFQNTRERRATGGFIGSYLLLDMNDGRIAKMEAKDVYETDGQLTEVIKAPPGIDKVADRLYMRDANFNPDFPTAAEEILWFLEHSKGPSADTVIAIDQTLVEKLIALSGPLRLPSLPFQLHADSFTDLLSYHTEAKIAGTATPKQLLFDLIPAFRNSLSGLTDPGVMLSLGREMVEKGHLQVYSKDTRIQALSEKWGVAGKMLSAGIKTDYLSVISTSIGGNKSDRYIQTDLRHDTEVAQNGALVDELTISKTHHWGKEQETKMANMIETYGTGALTAEALYYILGRGPNMDYMKIYVPHGSQIQDVQGIDLAKVEVYAENGYTVYGFIFGPVYPGETKQVSLRYRLPFQLSFAPVDNYRFMAENQAGAENVSLKKELHSADVLKIVESYPSTDPFSLIPVLEAAFESTQIFVSAITHS